MIHRILTCKNHPDLRWSTKDIAWTTTNEETGEGCYNGARNIFFKGTPSGRGMYSDGSGLDCTFVKDGRVFSECDCSPRFLMLAPEDKLVKREDDSK
jgi:hypothetical protein